jgi:hypothetical protein
MSIDKLLRRLASTRAQYSAHADAVNAGAQCGCSWKPGRCERLCRRYIRLFDRIRGLEHAIEDYFYTPDW